MALEYLYRCTSEGEINNGLKKQCDFEFVFEEGGHNCPLCGGVLERVPSGPTVSDLLRKGQQELDKKRGKK